MRDFNKIEKHIKQYCDFGYPVFLLTENSKFPLKGSKGVKEASTDPEKVREYLSRYPMANPNLAIAAQNILVIDVDNKNGKSGSDDLAEIERELGCLPKGCPKSQTPNGGFHFLVAKPSVKIVGTAGLSWKGRKAGIDLRIGNQYIVAPPSTIDGKTYKWIEQLVPVDQLPELSTEWIDFLAKPMASAKRVIPYMDLPIDRDRTSDIERCRKYVAKMSPGISEKKGHGQTYKVACVIFGKFGLTEAEGFPILSEYNQRCQPLWNEAELRHKMEDALKSSMTKTGMSIPVDDSANAIDDEFSEQEDVVTNYKPFPVDLLPDPLPAFIKSSARSIGCNEVLIVCPLLAGLGAAIGNCRTIRVKNDGDPWEEPPILWTMVVARSGEKKSPAQNATQYRFKEHEKNANQEYEDKLSKYKSDNDNYDSQLKEYSNGDITVEPTKPSHPVHKGILIGDTTVEGLATRLRYNKKGLFILRDELNAFLGSFGKYTNKSDTDASFYLEAYQAGFYSVTRKTTASFSINRCSVSIAGTIQPRVLTRFLSSSDSLDNGFIQRFMFAMPPSKKYYWTNETTGAGVVNEVQDIFNSLFSLRYSNNDYDPDVMELSPEASDLFIEEYNRIEDEKKNRKKRSVVGLPFEALRKGCSFGTDYSMR